MLDLSVVKNTMNSVYMASGCEGSPKSGFGGIHPQNLAIELSRRYHMSDTLSKFEEDWTNIVVAMVAIVDTHRQIIIHSSDFCLSNAMNGIGWTDNNDDDGDDVYSFSKRRKTPNKYAQYLHVVVIYVLVTY